VFGKTWMINLVLAAAVAFLATKAYDAWSTTERHLPKARGPKQVTASPQKALVTPKVPPESTFDAVVSHNLFAVSRSTGGGEEEAKAAAVEAKAKPDDRVVKLLQETIKRISVYGIMMVNEEKRALIKRPATPLLGKPGNRQPGPRPGEEIKWVRIGDTVDRFTVNEIRPTGVVLSAEGLVFNVVLYDKDSPKERVPEKGAEGPIVIDTKKMSEAGGFPEKVEGLKESGPDKKLPIEPEKKPPGSPVVQVLDDPEKR
jgi:hypothetical protein